MALIEKLSAIGNAIREKTGKEDLIKLEDMPAEIASIEDIEIADGIIQRSITAIDNNTVTKIGTYAFYACKQLKEAKFSKATTVGDFAFNSSAITTIELPEVTNIGKSVFYSTAVTNVYIPKVTSIGHYAFQGTGISDLVLPEITSIGMDTFKGCTAIKKAYIPNISSLITNSFQNCTNIEAIIIERTDKLCTITTNSFSGSSIVNGTGFVYVPDSLVDSYKAATNWSNHASQIKGLSEMPEDIKAWYEEVKVANGN